VEKMVGKLKTAPSAKHRSRYFSQRARERRREARQSKLFRKTGFR
jgi:hypothetical protein